MLAAAAYRNAMALYQQTMQNARTPKAKAQNERRARTCLARARAHYPIQFPLYDTPNG